MFIKNLMLISLFAIAMNSYAAGPSVGGGGDVIILPDDSVVLADPWIDSGAPQPNNMPPLRALNPRILQSINAYAEATKSLLSNLADNQSEITELLFELSKRKSELRFYGVQSAEELNNFCAPGGRKIYKLPDGASVQQVACTAGAETFIVEPLFVRLSLRDQSLLLVHERLTTLRDQYGGKNYAAVARFTTGLSSYLNVYREQALKKYRNLTEDEQKRLTDFYIAIEEIEFRNSEIDSDSFQWTAHVYGGGLVHANSQVDPSALIGLNANIHKNSVVHKNARILNSAVSINSVIGENTQILNSFVSVDSTIKENAVINNSSISVNSTIGAHTQIIDSSISQKSIIGASGTITNLKADEKISLIIGNNSQIKKMSFGRDWTVLEDVGVPGPGAFFKAGHNVSITNTSFNNLGSSYQIGDNSILDGSEIYLQKMIFGRNGRFTNSKLYGVELNIGEGVKFENSFVKLIGSNPFGQLIKVDVKKIADAEQLINVTVMPEVYQNYFSKDAKLKPIEANIGLDLKCSYSEKQPKETSINESILNEFNEGIKIAGKMTYEGREGSIFKPSYKYALQASVIVKVTTFKKAEDPSLVMISKEGRLTHAGFSRSPFLYNLSNLHACIHDNADLMNKLHEAIVTPTQEEYQILKVFPEEI